MKEQINHCFVEDGLYFSALVDMVMNPLVLLDVEKFWSG
jgi:hypothetical protein